MCLLFVIKLGHWQANPRNKSALTKIKRPFQFYICTNENFLDFCQHLIFFVYVAGFPELGALDRSLWQQQLRSSHRRHHRWATSHHADYTFTPQIPFSWQWERISWEQWWKHTKVWTSWHPNISSNLSCSPVLIWLCDMLYHFQRQRSLVFPKCPKRQRRVAGESDSYLKQISHLSKCWSLDWELFPCSTSQWHNLRSVTAF